MLFLVIQILSCVNVRYVQEFSNLRLILHYMFIGIHISKVNGFSMDEDEDVDDPSEEGYSSEEEEDSEVRFIFVGSPGWARTSL